MADHSQGSSPSSTDPTSNSSTSATTTSTNASETIDDRADGWTWKGMVECDEDDLYKGSGRAGGPGTYADYTFTGTGVVVYGMSAATIAVDGASHAMGSVSVWIDGKQVGTNSVFSKAPLLRFIDFKIDGLPEGSHILHVGPAGGWALVDYIKTLHTPPQVQEQPAALSSMGLVYRLVPHNAEHYALAATGDEALNGAGLILNLQGESTRQLWHLKPVGGSTHELCPVDDPTEAVWIVPPSPTGWKYQSLVSPLLNKANQELTLTEMRNGWYKIASANDENVFLSVSDTPIVDGTWVMGYPPNGMPSQEWYLQVAQN